MFRKLLIANRGEIALRIARTCRRMGLPVAGVHSDADRDAPHVRAIGESVRLGPAPARESYLDVDRVVMAARQVGADAVHPGYGFLAENPALADALDAAGIAFVGPSAQVLRDLGDKACAKRHARASGVPTIPGPAEAIDDPARVLAAARELGFPVLLKAAAGGGGKGIRVVRDEAGAGDAIAAAMREGLNAFGSAALLVERFLPRGRHVEVQILGDGRGGVLHLWERECSLQRRHQKVVEEAPALALPPGLRERLLEAAVALGRHLNYRALGTVEFLVVGDEGFFLEVNPRLQVEHPVTECVTGLDLVELQLRAAAGEGLPLAQHAVRCEGHAIEARVYAEDPAHGFVPSTGRIVHLDLPDALARVDSGVQTGSTITTHYDPMVAKLIVRAGDRGAALAGLREAISATRLAGVASNLDFLARLLADPAVAGEVPDTGTIDRLASGLRPPPPAWRAALAHIAAAWMLASTRRDAPEAPVGDWRGMLHWRLGAPVGYRPLQPQYEVVDGAHARPASVAATGDGGAMHVEIGEGDGARVAHRVTFGERGADGAVALAIDGISCRLWLSCDGERVQCSDGRVTESVLVRPARRRERAADPGSGAAVLAPLTGKVLELRVANGEAVGQGQVLLVIESMKMELRIVAPFAGVAQAIVARPGDMVDRGAVLVRVEAREAAA